jgi:hypothetical protein
MPDRAVVAIPRSFADMILVCAATPARRKLSSTRLGRATHTRCAA